VLPASNATTIVSIEAPQSLQGNTSAVYKSYGGVVVVLVVVEVLVVVAGQVVQAASAVAICVLIGDAFLLYCLTLTPSLSQNNPFKGISDAIILAVTVMLLQRVVPLPWNEYVPYPPPAQASSSEPSLIVAWNVGGNVVVVVVGAIVVVLVVEVLVVVGGGQVCVLQLPTGDIVPVVPSAKKACNNPPIDAAHM
jgi:hypothetical protein